MKGKGITLRSLCQQLKEAREIPLPALADIMRSTTPPTTRALTDVELDRAAGLDPERAPRRVSVKKAARNAGRPA